eukprot:6598664-Pyramimonas_sp.AAC.1
MQIPNRYPDSAAPEARLLAFPVEHHQGRPGPRSARLRRRVFRCLRDGHGCRSGRLYRGEKPSKALALRARRGHQAPDITIAPLTLGKGERS